MATFNNAPNLVWLLLAFVVFEVKCNDATVDTLPHLCYNVKCPPLSEMSCPDDSSVREILNTIELEQITGAPEASAEDKTFYNATEIDEDIYAECCLAKKCHCKTCYIPDCHGEDEVVIELQPESMHKPGHCCGEYECQRTPNCQMEEDSQLYWLKGCQRCHCFSGKPMCIQICDEAINKTKAICKPEKLNVFFEHGESWRVGCYECECVDGVEKCVLPFCSNINCPRERQVTLKDGCCPICWPDCAPMPNELLAGIGSSSSKYGNTAHRYDDDDDITEEVEEEEAKEHSHNSNINNQNNNNNNNHALHGIDYSAAENEIDTLPDIPFEEDDNDADSVVATNNAKQLSNANVTTITANNNKGKISETTVTNIMIHDSHAHTTANPVGNSSVITQTTPQAESLPSLMLPTTAAPQTHAALASDSSIVTACPPTTISNEDSARHNNAAAANFQLYPKDDILSEIHVVTETCKHWLIYIIMGILVALIAVLIAWIIQLRLKQRSYRPVSHIDDNFNKMSCNNIKATNAYV